MNPLKISVEDKEDYFIIHMSGTAQALNKQSDEVSLIRETFRDLAKSGATKVLLNLKEVDYLASNTIGAFLSGNSMIKKNGGKLVIYNASEYIMQIFNIVQLQQVLPIKSTLEDALDEVNQA